MKSFIGIVFGSLLLLVFSSMLYAQESDIDQERMNRDIRIMGSALEELFRIEDGKSAGLYTPPGLPDFSIGARSGFMVTGSYLPGYGVIFTIPDATSRSVGIFTSHGSVNIESQSGERTFAFSVDTNGSDNSITEEGIKARVTEFMVNYAPTIGQLRNDENVLVIYGAESPRGRGVSIRPGRVVFGSGSPDRVVINNSEGGDESDGNDKPEIPIISMSVKKSDLDAFRSGRVSESVFSDRIDTVTKRRDETNRQLDLEVFANILETGLKENVDELLRVTRRPTHLHLNNFGVMYRVELSDTPRFFWGDVHIPQPMDFQFLNETFSASFDLPTFDLDTFRFNADSLQLHFQSEFLSETDREKMREEMEKAREKVDEARRELEERLPEIRQKQEDARRKVEQEQARLREQLDRQREMSDDPEAIREALENRIQLIRELMVDYGRTLSSLNDDQSLLLSMHISGRRDNDLPNRIDLRITKANLQAMDNGTISREQAMDRIIEQRY